MAFLGTFNIHVSPEAEFCDFMTFSNDERQKLLDNIHYDEELHDIIRINIGPEFVPNKYSNPKTNSRRDYSRVNQVRISLKRESIKTRFMGLLPRSSGRSAGLAAGKLIFEISPKGFRLNLEGSAKGLARRRDCEILASFTQEFTQWLFLKPAITHNQFSLSIFLLTPKDLPKTERILSCNVMYMENGRIIEQETPQLTIPLPQVSK